MATLNYTTTVAASKTVAEVQELLRRSGAAGVGVTYADQRPVAVSFTLAGPHGDRAFTLPVDVVGMQKALTKQWRSGEIRKGYTDSDHAERVAWRVVKDWLAAQLTLVAAQMATLDQVMLPYLHVDGDRTLYEAYRDREQLALEVGRG